VSAHGFIRNVSGAPLHAIVDAERTHGAEGFVVKGGNAQGSSQFFIKFAQIGELGRLGRQLDAVICQKKFLVAGVPQASELASQHDGRQDGHLETAVWVLTEFSAGAVFFHADDTARAAHRKAYGSKGVHLFLLKAFFNIPHGLLSVIQSGRPCKAAMQSLCSAAFPA
jgi:hypothetical protein